MLDSLAQIKRLLVIHRRNAIGLEAAIEAARNEGQPTLHIENQLESTRREIARLEAQEKALEAGAS
jgi:hypothetical protein